MKPLLYIDLDGVVADYDAHVHLKIWEDPERVECIVPKHYYTNLPLIEGAVEALKELSEDYDLYFLSTPQWSNPNCWKEKRIWVEANFGELMFKRLILTHNKGLLKGDYLIDDRIAHGVDNFEGEHIHFGTERFPNWETVVKYLKHKIHKDLVKKMFPSMV